MSFLKALAIAGGKVAKHPVGQAALVVIIERLAVAANRVLEPEEPDQRAPRKGAVKRKKKVRKRS